MGGCDKSLPGLAGYKLGDGAADAAGESGDFGLGVSMAKETWKEHHPY